MWWLSRAVFAVADQASFALTNFAVSVLLARWLAPSEYGAFAVAFSVLLLLGAVQGALVIEPMLVFGPAHYPGRLSGYVRELVAHHFAITGALGAVLLGVVAVAGAAMSGDLVACLATVALAGPLILFLWVMRRACYVDARPELAAAAGVGYAAVVVLALALLNATDTLSGPSAIAMTGAASLLTGLWLLRALPGERERPARREVARRHWTYGRWALPTGLLSWVPANLPLLLLPVWYSLADTAELKAALVLAMPVLQLNAALATLVLPGLVRARMQGTLARTATNAVVVLTAAALLYWPFVGIFGNQLCALLFGGRYELSAQILWSVGALPVVAAVSLVLASVLRAQERPDHVFRAYVAATVFAVTAGVAIIARFGVEGAVVTLFVSSVVTGAVCAWYVRRRGVMPVAQVAEAPWST